MTNTAASSNRDPEVQPASPGAWQPLTPQGIASFAEAHLGRLLLIQAFAAVLITVAVLWFVHTRWLAVVEEAIRRLPQAGEISGGRLNYSGPNPQRLAQNRFLGIAIDLEHTGEVRWPSDFFLECGRDECRLHSLLGYRPLYYTAPWPLPFNRPQVQPWYDAWKPALLGLASLAFFAHILLLWAVGAACYMTPAWTLAFFTDRDLSLWGAYKCAGAALIPGGIFLACAVLAYGWSLFDLPRLLLAIAVHLLVGWLYLTFGVLARPRVTTRRARNPFRRS